MSRLEEEMQKSRVVVTGMGAITPIGLTVEEFWENVKAQKVGIGAITKFDTTDFKVKLAAEVKGFDAQAYMDFKQAKRMELFSQYAVAAAGQAIKDAGLDMEKEDAYRVGTSIGSGIGSLDAMEREHKKLLERGPGRINPLLVPLMITNMAAGNVSIAYGLKGKNINAEIAGYGCSSDAYHITSPAEDGSGAARAMTNAMQEAGVLPQEVDYINAHGTGTHHNDLFETRAIKLAFGEAAENVPVSSTKSMVGHLLGAAGAVELIACIKSVTDGYLHPNVGLTETEDEMDLQYIKGKGIETEVKTVLSNSLGFGGHNATLLVKKFS